jgi:hypothetical protein
MKKKLLYQNLGVKLARQDFVVQSFINRKKKNQISMWYAKAFACTYVLGGWASHLAEW